MRILARLLFVCAAFVGAVCWGQSQQANSIKTVHGRGRDADYRMAVYEALVQAMSQVQGVSLQDSRDAFMDSLKQQKSTKAGDTSIDEVRESLKQNVSARTKGHVLSFAFTEERYDKELAMWFVEVDAKVPGQYVVGLHPDNRRRMIVLPFRSLTGEVDVFGKKIALGTSCESIAATLNEHLTQTRRFTMLDRAFDEQMSAELSRLDANNASPGDYGRFNQKLVTDYMVTGTVKMYSSPATTFNAYTGMSSTMNGPFIEVSYRVILVPTTQLKWASTVVVPYSACAGATVEEAISSAFAVAAREISYEIIDNIYPMRITAKTAFELVINQGGSGNLREGEIYTVFNRGQVIRDVSSGESLGAPEEQIAQIRITRVDPKMSYAVVAEGTPLAQIPVGAVVRRPRGATALNGQNVGSQTEVKQGANGTVIPPWKKR